MTTQQLLFTDCYLLSILSIEQIWAQIPCHTHGVPSPHASFPSPNLWEDGSCSLYPDVWLWSYFNSDLLWAPSPDSSSSKGYIWCDLTPAALSMHISCHLQSIFHTSVHYQPFLEHVQYHPTSRTLRMLFHLPATPFPKVPTGYWSQISAQLDDFLKTI